jgi:ribosomal protein L35AE/L33A
MPTLHIENTVHDYDAWKAAFDKFERFRADNKMLSYRISRYADDPGRLMVDLEFATTDDAQAYAGKLAQIHATPQSASHLVSTTGPQLVEAVVERTFTDVPA